MDLKRQLKTPHIWAIGVGMVISGQYFGWNFGFHVAGITGMYLAAGIVTLFYICFMLSYAELATMIPTAGGPSAYAAEAMGRQGGFIAGLACLIEFIFAPPAIAIAIGSYVHTLWPMIPSHLAGTTAFIICILINLTGTKDVALFELVVTLLALIGLIIYYCANLYVSPSIHNTIQSHPLPHQSWLAAIPFAIWLYLAIEGIAMTAEETLAPQKTLPRGFILAIVTLAICSALTLWLTATHCRDPRANIDYPLLHTLTEQFNRDSWLTQSVGILGLFGLIASLNGIIIGYTRQTFALARAKYLPKFFTSINSNDTAIWALLIPGCFGLLCTSSANLSNNLIILSAFGAICNYGISMISLFILRFKKPHIPRSYKVWFPWVPALALGLSIFFILCVFKYALLPNYLDLFGLDINLALAFGIISLGSLVIIYRKRKSH